MFGAMPLKLYHQTGGSSLEPLLAPLQALDEKVPFFQWQTCLRSLVLVPDSHVEFVDLSSSGEWLEGESAYRRLLEIVCGLHSPLVGETEVFGQFKDAIQNRLVPSQTESENALETAFVSTLQKWSKALIEDVKLVRQKHLLDLGSQSYGSLVRREVRGFNCPQIEFLGSGRLANEILPWLLKALKNETTNTSPLVTVHARDVAKARRRIESTTSENIQFSDLSRGPLPSTSVANGSAARVLIVAAPMSAIEITEWVREIARFDLIIDLRAESRHDSLASKGLTQRLRALDEVFSSIESAREVASVKKNAALQLIEQRVVVRGATALHRPFGWDDVWS